MPLLTPDEYRKLREQPSTPMLAPADADANQRLIAEYRANGGKPLRPKRRDDPEHRMQCEIVNDFAQAYPDLSALLYAVPNGGQRNKVAAAKMKREGQKRGIPDLVLPVARGSWHGLYVECKVLPNTPSIDQRRIMELLTQQGYYCQVVFTAQQAAELFENYLSLPKHG